MEGQSPGGGPGSVPEQGPSDQPLPAPYNPPGPGSADFNPNDFIWDGGTWRSPDRRYWWNGSQWTSGEQPVQTNITTASSTPSLPTPQSAFSNDGQRWWDGNSWRQTSPDHSWWWDGQDWQPTGTKPSSMPNATGAAIGLGCTSMAVGVFAIAGSGACSSGELPGFALVVGAIGIGLAFAAAVWISARRGHPALYLLSVTGLLVSVPAMAFGIRGSCS